MELKPNFILICDQAFLTAGTNNLNLIGIFSQINARQFPVKYSHFALVVSFNVEKFGKYILRAQILDPDGVQLTQADLSLNISSSPFQVISNFENLSFNIPGVYEIKVLLNEEYVGSAKIKLSIVNHQNTGLA